MANQGKNVSDLPSETKEVDLISNFHPERCTSKNHHFNTEMDLTLNLSLSGSGGKCPSILPKERMPPQTSSSSASIGVGPTPRRRMSWKQRAREAHLAPNEVLQVEPLRIAPPQRIIASTSTMLHGQSNQGVINDGMTKHMLKVMPRVTTTGGVPNGREIEGFLFHFPRGRMCVVCVCHGHFLSPREFVLHAGGSDLENPMRLIHVQPGM